MSIIAEETLLTTFPVEHILGEISLSSSDNESVHSVSVPASTDDEGLFLTLHDSVESLEGLRKLFSHQSDTVSNGSGSSDSVVPAGIFPSTQVGRLDVFRPRALRISRRRKMWPCLRKYI
jgi:hypothetical protein